MCFLRCDGLFNLFAPAVHVIRVHSVLKGSFNTDDRVAVCVMFS